MPRRYLSLSLVLVLLSSAIAMAQPSRPERPGRDRDGARRVRDFGPAQPQRALERMKQELKLDDDQYQRAQPLFAEFASSVRALRDSAPRSPDEADKYRAMREEIQAAREADDQEKMQEILGRMRTMREERDQMMEPIRRQVQAAQKQLHDQMLPILREDQKARFKRIWEEEFEGKPRPRIQRVDPRVLKSIVDELSGLSADQKREIDQAFRAYREETRKPDLDDATKATLERTLGQDVFAALNDEQSQQAQAKIRDHIRKDRREKARSEDPNDNKQNPAGGPDE